MATANFFAPGFDDQVEQQNIDRQRKMADLLRQQSVQPMDNGQMVGGHYVAPSFTQGLAKLLQGYNAREADTMANDRQKALAEAVRGRNAAEFGKFTNLLTGQPARDVQPLTPNDDNGNAMPVAKAEATAPDLAGAYKYAASASNPALQQFGIQGALTNAQEQAKLAQAQAQQQRQMQLWQQSQGNPQTFMQLGGDPKLAKEMAESGNWGKEELISVNGQLVGKLSGKPYGAAIPKQADAPNLANDLLVPDGKGGMKVNTPLVQAKQSIAAAGKSVNSNTVINKGPDAFNVELAKLDAKQLDQWRDKAETARNSLGTVERLRAAETEGAYSGGLANQKVGAANLLNGITGITVPGLVGSQKYNAEASKLVLDHVKALGANPSNADREFIEKTVPQLASSKEARQALVDYIEEQSRKSISTFELMDNHARTKGGLSGFKYPSTTSAPAPKPSGQKPTVSNWE